MKLIIAKKLFPQFSFRWMTYFLVLMLPMAATASEIDDGFCFNRQEAVEIFGMIENYVKYRNFKEIVIYDSIGLIKSNFFLLVP